MFLLLPIALAYVAVYAPDFDPNCYHFQGEWVEIQASGATPELLVQKLRSMGIDAVFTSEVDEKADALIVLSCSNIDRNALLNYINNGGNVILDLFAQDFPELNLQRGEPFAGTVIVDVPSMPIPGEEGLYMEYLDGRAYLVSEAHVDASGPIVDPYRARMYYAGPEVIDKSGSFNSGFDVGNVLLWRKNGSNILATGCILCADPSLLADLCDWVVDGSVDFPRVHISRKVVPRSAMEGQTVQDIITATLPPEDVQISLLYDTDAAECGEFLGSDEKKGGDYVVFTANYRAGKTCHLPMAILRVDWMGGTRYLYLQPTNPVIYPTPIPMPDLSMFLFPLLLIVLLLLPFAYTYWRRGRIRRKIREIERAMKLVEYKYRTGKISRSVYEELVKDYMAELSRLRALLPEEEKSNNKKSNKKEDRKG